MSCNECAMTDKRCPSSGDYPNIPCWSLTELMQKGGQLLTATDKEMVKSSGRLKSKLPTDGVSEYSGPSLKHSLNVPMHKKGLFAITNFIAFYMESELQGCVLHFLLAVYFVYKTSTKTFLILPTLRKASLKIPSWMA